MNKFFQHPKIEIRGVADKRASDGRSREREREKFNKIKMFRRRAAGRIGMLGWRCCLRLRPDPAWKIYFLPAECFSLGEFFMEAGFARLFC